MLRERKDTSYYLANHLSTVSTHYANGRIVHAHLDFQTFPLHVVGMYKVSSPLENCKKTHTKKQSTVTLHIAWEKYSPPPPPPPPR